MSLPAVVREALGLSLGARLTLGVVGDVSTLQRALTLDELVSQDDCAHPLGNPCAD